MTWTAPRAYPVALLVDADDLNTYWRDNFNHLRATLSAPAIPCTYTLDNWGGNTQTLAATTCYYGRVRGGGTVDSVAFHVTTSAGDVSVAVYDNTGAARSARPNSRQQTSGAVACPAAGAADVALGGSVAVTPGDHWLAISASSTPVLAGGSENPAASNLGAGLAYRETAHPAPASASATPTAIINQPLLIGA